MQEQGRTLPARFFANASKLASRVAHYYPSAGKWVPVGWATMATVVRHFAAGLTVLGHAPSEAVAIVAPTRREWLYSDLAILACGGITVGIYPSLGADECRAILAHSNARYCIVGDREALAKVRVCLDREPSLKAIIVLDDPGDTGDRRIFSFDEILRLGKRHTSVVAERLAGVGPLDAASFLYTSGTTGGPKGVMFTHGNLMAALRSLETLQLGDSDVGFSYLPLAHCLQRMVDYYGVWMGMQSAYGRTMGSLLEDLAEVRPTVMATVPHLLESLYGSIYEQMQRSPAGQRLVTWANEVGKQVAHHKRYGREVPATLQAQRRLAQRLVFNRLRACLGGRMRRIIVQGSSVAPEIVQFFEAAGVRIWAGWGMTETFALGTLNRDGTYRSGSVGKPLPGVEIELAEDGELLVSSASLCSGYYRAQAETVAAFTPTGFFRTGDVAKVDGDGFYYVEDRKSDIIVTSGGERVAPQQIESQLRVDPRIDHVVVVGHGRPYLVALIAVSDALRGSMDENTIVRVIDGILAAVNINVSRSEQIRAFRLLPHALSEATGDLTPMLQVKRQALIRKFGYLIDEMYE